MMIYVYTKKLKMVSTLYLKLICLLIKIKLDNDEHFWLILSHNVKKNMELVMNVEKKILISANINVAMIL